MPVRGWASPHLSVTASEKVIVKQKGLQCMCVCVCVQQFLSWASHRCAWHWLKFLSRGQSVLTVELSARRLLFLHGWMKFLLKWRLSAVTRLSRPSVSGSSCEEIFWEMLCLKEEKMLRRWIVIFFLKTERWCHTPAGFMFSESGQTWGQNMLKKNPKKPNVSSKNISLKLSHTCIIYSGDSINRFEVFITSDKQTKELWNNYVIPKKLPWSYCLRSKENFKQQKKKKKDAPAQLLCYFCYHQAATPGFDSLPTSSV